MTFSARAIALIIGGAIILALSAVALTQDSKNTNVDMKWDLVWADEFDGPFIDQTKWSFEVNCWGGGNEERQCYTDETKNARVKDGVLEISAVKGRSKGAALPEHMWKTPEDAKNTATKPYSSARLRTIGKGDWRYGRMEIRAKLPGGQGVWPAIWMLPTDNLYGGWAASGEIDIMEAVNLDVPCERCDGGKENHILGTLHFGAPWPDNRYKSNETTLDTATQSFHTYAIEWSAGQIDWFIDDVKFASQTETDWHSSSELAKAKPFAPFDQRFHMILNLAIGGGLPEGRNKGGVDPLGFPKAMEVDFVRVYECAADRLEGLACQHQGQD